MINLKNIDYKTIKEDLYNYLKNRDDFNIIQEALGTNLDMFLSIIAGYSTYNAYKYKMTREETYLDTAKLDSSVFQIAKTFGFNIKRSFSPKVSIKYNDTPTIEIMPGTILGSYEIEDENGRDILDVVYLDDIKIIEKGDEIPCYIGKFKQLIYTPIKNIESLHLIPEELSSIHNEVWIKEKEYYKITKSVEDYLIYKIPVDFSDTNYSTNILLYDVDNFFGNYDLKNKEIEILYLETDGETEIDLNKLQLNDNYYPYMLLTKGGRGHSIDEIRKQVPFYFQTLRRMVTANDHKYILESVDFIKQVGVERDNGEKRIYKVIINEDYLDSEGNFNQDLNSVFIINGKKITINLLNGMTKDEVNELLYTELNKNRNINVIIENDYVLVDTIDGRVLTDFEFIVGEGFDSEIIQFGKPPLCCTVKVYYLKQDTIDEPILLTDEELKLISEKIYPYKMVGTKLLFIPAQPINKDLSIKIRLIDSKYFDIVKEEILNIIKEYELQLDKDFIYGKFLRDVANISIFNEDTQETLNPITYIEPNQEMYDIILSNKYYIKFNNIDIQIG